MLAGRRRLAYAVDIVGMAEVLEAKLLAVARQHVPSERVPYAFEKRIMARLAGLPQVDPWTYWERMLWRAVAPCLAIMALLSLCAFFSSNYAVSDNPADDFETTVLAGINQIGETW